jgi:hypothetical protein
MSVTAAIEPERRLPARGPTARAFALGWQMSEVYQGAAERPTEEAPASETLPSVAGLTSGQQTELAIEEIAAGLHYFEPQAAEDTLDAEGYVSAARVAFSRFRRLLFYAFRLWPVTILVLALVLVAVLLLWRSSGVHSDLGALAAFVGALGISWRSAASTTGKIAASLETPVWGAALDDAIGRSIVCLPTVPNNPAVTAPSGPRLAPRGELSAADESAAQATTASAS